MSSAPFPISWENKQRQYLLQDDTATASGGRHPEHLYPHPSPRGALCHSGRTVCHELSVLFIYDLKELRRIDRYIYAISVK